MVVTKHDVIAILGFLVAGYALYLVHWHFLLLGIGVLLALVGILGGRKQ